MTDQLLKNGYYVPPLVVEIVIIKYLLYNHQEQAVILKKFKKQLNELKKLLGTNDVLPSYFKPIPGETPSSEDVERLLTRCLIYVMRLTPPIKKVTDYMETVV